MGKIEVICIDMFQTLVNIYPRVEFIWKRILKEEYSKEKEKKYANIVDKKIIEKFHEDSNGKNFENFKTIFLDKFTEVFLETRLKLDPIEATRIFVEEHGLAEPYKDCKEFLDIASEKYPICLISDADIEMVQPLLEKFKFDKVLISEQVQAYKKDREGKIFKKALEYYKVEPENVLHIGDSLSDIIGANSVGIKSCWLNRNNHAWKYNVKPTYEVRSLLEVIEILDESYDSVEAIDFA